MTDLYNKIQQALISVGEAGATSRDLKRICWDFRKVSARRAEIVLNEMVERGLITGKKNNRAIKYVNIVPPEDQPNQKLIQIYMDETLYKSVFETGMPPLELLQIGMNRVLALRKIQNISPKKSKCHSCQGWHDPGAKCERKYTGCLGHACFGDSQSCCSCSI